ncbi:MAG: NmrA family NAD(P)-binding protein [Verrucomicrobia bacterium]|nr:NmrA family NAD(P)-binding protein [Verrucomicrobiota bacterium]MBV8274266.1 NmrA family NAD(P)-binding protein [Verrucomicrobiota bacterium]
MPSPILVTGAAGGAQGSTGNRVVQLLVDNRLPVRAIVHRIDERSERLRELGVDVLAGDLLNPAFVHQALQDIKRAYFTFPVDDGLLEATTIFAWAAREAKTDLIVNMSQFQGSEEAASFRNLQHRLADQIFDWAQVGAVHLNPPPFFENVRALVVRSVSEQNSIFLPWGDGEAVIPLIGAEDCARVAAAMLLSPKEPEQKHYALVSETLRVSEIVTTLSAVLERPIKYVSITDEQWVEAVRDRVNSHAMQHLSSLWRYFRTAGLPKAGPEIAEPIQRITGKQPQSLKEFFQLNVAAFGEGR